MRISAGLPTGVSGIFFDQARARRRLELRLARSLEAAGYCEAILPILDYFDPYEPLLSSSSREALYRFVDRDGELLAVRADFTPMLARLIAPRLDTLELPLRLFYRGDVIRRQEVRPGQQREYSALGAELLGGERAAADEEIVRLFLRLVTDEELGQLRVVLGFAGALDRLLTAAPDGRELAAAIGRREREAARRAGGALYEIVERGMPANPSALGDEAAGRLEALIALRDRLQSELGGGGVELTLDLAEFAANTLAADLEIEGSRWTYYDGVVFRAYHLGTGREVGRGGRYDALFSALGAEVPAVGFSLGLDALLPEGDEGAVKGEG